MRNIATCFQTNREGGFSLIGAVALVAAVGTVVAYSLLSVPRTSMQAVSAVKATTDIDNVVSLLSLQIGTSCHSVLVTPPAGLQPNLLSLNAGATSPVIFNSPYPVLPPGGMKLSSAYLQAPSRLPTPTPPASPGPSPLPSYSASLVVNFAKPAQGTVGSSIVQSAIPVIVTVDTSKNNLITGCQIAAPPALALQVCSAVGTTPLSANPPCQPTGTGAGGSLYKCTCCQGYVYYYFPADMSAQACDYSGGSLGPGAGCSSSATWSCNLTTGCDNLADQMTLSNQSVSHFTTFSTYPYLSSPMPTPAPSAAPQLSYRVTDAAGSSVTLASGNSSSIYVIQENDSSKNPVYQFFGVEGLLASLGYWNPATSAFSASQGPNNYTAAILQLCKPVTTGVCGQGSNNPFLSLNLSSTSLAPLNWSGTPPVGTNVNVSQGFLDQGSLPGEGRNCGIDFNDANQ